MWKRCMADTTIVQAFNQQSDSIERFYVINEMLSDSAGNAVFYRSCSDDAVFLQSGTLVCILVGTGSEK